MRAVSAVLLLTAAVLPGLAHAGYQTQGQVSQTFTPINGTALNVSTSQDSQVALPFDFRYFGSTYRSVNVGVKGYLNFSGSAHTNFCYGIPKNTQTGGVIAPWWGNWDGAAGSVTWAVSGVSPNRVATFQWVNVWLATDSAKHGATFQVKLYETTGKIEFDYGASNYGSYTFSTGNRAGVGIQNEAGSQGYQGLACTTATSANCNTTDFSPNTAIVFYTPADLSPLRVYADETGFAGVPMRMGVEIANNGGDDAKGVTARFYLSSDSTLDANDTDLGLTRAVDISVQQKRDVVVSPLLPKTLAAGTWYLFAKIDPANAIAEDDETNNVGPTKGLAFGLGQKTPDLAVGTVTVQASAKAGDTVSVASALSNVGNALVGSCTASADCGDPSSVCDAGRCRTKCTQNAECQPNYACGAPSDTSLGTNVCNLTACASNSDCPSNESCAANACSPRQIGYGVYISDNAVISVADRRLSSGVVKLTAGIPAFGSVNRTDSVTLPSDLAPGDYYVGVIMDPDNELSEISEINNSGASTGALTIVSDTLTIATKTLPEATVRAPYGVWITASGGSGKYTFSLAGGKLPAGVNLSSSGELAGIPSETGDFAIKVAAQSSTLTATQDLTLKVNAGVVPLTIITGDLPAAEFNKPYTTSLAAVGGKPPYAWGLSSGADLPPGLVLGTGGTIEGQPTVDGTFSFQVEVKDSAGSVKAQPLTLTVASPDRMRIVTSALPDAMLGKAYTAVLSVAGGKAPFKWEVVESRLLPLAPTDTAQPGKPELPAGLALGIDKGVSKIVGKPQFAGTYAITLRATDDNKKTDLATLSLTVRYESGLEITTQGLPDALVNQQYLAQLFTEGGEGAVHWSLTCVPSYNDKNELQPCRQALPPQFTLTDDGVIATQEPVAAPEADENGNVPARTTWSFMVKAQDQRGRTAVRALSVTVRVDQPPPQPAPASCQTGVGGPSDAAFAALALAEALRRLRSRSRGRKA